MSTQTRNLWILIALSTVALSVSALLASLANPGGESTLPPAVLVTYFFARIAIFVGSGYGLIRFAGCRRFQAVALVGFLGFVDQVLIKSILMIREMRLHPAQWEGLAQGDVIFGIASAYLYFLPIVLILAFVGTWLTTERMSDR